MVDDTKVTKGSASFRNLLARVNIVEFCIVLIAGGIGGFASVMTVLGTADFWPLRMSGVFAAIVEPVFRGALAGGLGVYLFAPLDRSDLVRTIFFAVACGLAFQTVLEHSASAAGSATQSITNTEQKLAQQAFSQAKANVESIPATAEPLTPEKQEELKKAATDVFRTLPKLPAAERLDAQFTIESVISKFQASGNDAIASDLQKAAIENSLIAAPAE